MHLSLHRQSDGNLIATVKINSPEDAQLAISKLHRAKLGHKRIIISYAQTPNSHHPYYLRSNVLILLFFFKFFVRNFISLFIFHY